ncbi:hypothetical protein [Acinetobacter colistiniresistens]|uniref:hypothetical protein n=1 Tax=Acinetobacter colistiniresistens TaxID=280145 RepID=UPI0012507F4B|nr:hypothetical protein [Acinetobacter colistiniresistens]
MKVKFIDVVHVTNKLYKEGDIGEFSDLTAEELIKKGLAALADDIDSDESSAEKTKSKGPSKRKVKTNNTDITANEQNGDSDENQNGGTEESNQDTATDSDANAE